MDNIKEKIKYIDNRLYFDFNELCSMIGLENVPYQFKIISDKNKLIKNKVKYVSESQTYMLIIRNNLDSVYDNVFEAFNTFKRVDVESVEINTKESSVDSINDLRNLYEKVINQRNKHIDNLIIFLESTD